MSTKMLKNERIPMSILLCAVLILFSLLPGLVNGEYNKNGSYSSESMIKRSPGISIDVAERFGSEDSLSEEITTGREGESIRPLIRYGRILLTAIYVAIQFISAFEIMSFLPIQTTSCSHLFTINYLHDTDGRK